MSDSTWQEGLWAVIDADLQEIDEDKHGFAIFNNEPEAKLYKHARDSGPGRNAGFYVTPIAVRWNKRELVINKGVVTFESKGE